MSTTEKCPMCHSPVVRTADNGAIAVGRLEPAPVSPALLVAALDNEQVARAVARLGTGEFRLAMASVCLEGIGGRDAFFTEQDVRDEAEAAARCDGVAKQLRDHTRFEEAATFREMAARHRTRATRIVGLLPSDVQRKLHQQMHSSPLDANAGAGRPTS